MVKVGKDFDIKSALEACKTVQSGEELANKLQIPKPEANRIYLAYVVQTSRTKNEAAERLGINMSTLNGRISGLRKEHGIRLKRFTRQSQQPTKDEVERLNSFIDSLST